ncbi:hypothetical protein CEXT_168701 [Caerostris extrusa]|uniref:Uncharacterized protein n=1 Tax=Caerostris extrusa TaxID=172846 RepID=A0AAV4NLB6_CAEEX|nr:hypothetical protein CEXT_168701 [Caerostris extrusa]
MCLEVLLLYPKEENENPPDAGAEGVVQNCRYKCMMKYWYNITASTLCVAVINSIAISPCPFPKQALFSISYFFFLLQQDFSSKDSINPVYIKKRKTHTPPKRTNKTSIRERTWTLGHGALSRKNVTQCTGKHDKDGHQWDL